ncbi:MAG: sulfur transferase domain-containing protein, partial [Pseudomonadota bacterium]
MTDFRALSDAFYASPQITLADIEAATEAGIAVIVNNRPDGEDPSAP